LLLGAVPLYGGSATVDGERVDGRRRPSVGYVPQLETIDWNCPVAVEEGVVMGRATASGPWPGPRTQDRREMLRLLERLKTGRPVWRLNWAIKPSTRLNLLPRYADEVAQAASALTPDAVGDRW